MIFLLFICGGEKEARGSLSSKILRRKEIE